MRRLRSLVAGGGAVLTGLVLLGTSPATAQSAAWSVVPSPSPGTKTVLDAVSCISATACTATGNHGNSTLIESWNGTSWSVVPSPNPGITGDHTLFSVSCVSATFCAATGRHHVGGGNGTLVESWNGTTWSAVPSPSLQSQSDLNGVSCVSAAFCIAVGVHFGSTGISRTMIEAWNGTSWSIVPSPNQGTQSLLDGVSCAAGTCMATGSYTSGTSSITLTESGPS